MISIIFLRLVRFSKRIASVRLRFLELEVSRIARVLSDPLLFRHWALRDHIQTMLRLHVLNVAPAIRAPVLQPEYARGRVRWVVLDVVQRLDVRAHALTIADCEERNRWVRVAVRSVIQTSLNTIPTLHRRSPPPGGAWPIARHR